LKPKIHIKKIWFDEDIIELQVSVCDGNSVFVNSTYAGWADLKVKAKSIDEFRSHVFGGIHDLAFGSFGAEIANGAFQARLHYNSHKHLYISTRQQSEYFEFSVMKVANEASLFLKSEAGLLDRFVLELTALANGNTDEATLECLPA
jgi:hypothetical protein